MESRSGRRRLRSSSEKQHSLTEDRISALPDDLILLILARLRSIAAAVRTSVLSRRWSGGLWTRLLEIVFRDLPFPSLEAALGRVDSPAVSLLEIRVHDVHRPDTHVRDAGFNSLLRAAARLAPEEFVFRLPLDSLDVTDNGSLVVDLPCFHRSTSIVMDTYFLSLRVPDGVAFPALQTLSLAGRVPDLDPLPSCCPRLRTLRLRNVFHGGDLRVGSPWLQELFVVRLFQRKHRIDIAAPVLKQLSMSFVSSGANISVLAPMAEKILWDCRYSKAPVVFVFVLWRLDQVTLRTAERQAHLRSLQICAHAASSVSGTEEHTFAEEIEKHMIAGFSVLELHLTTNGHAFGALVFHLLKMARICGSIRRLKVILERSTVKEECPFDCFCEPWNWRSQTISLSALEEVEINGFQGYGQEIDFLKLVSQCAPMLKKTTMMLSEETSAIKDEFAKI